MPTEKQTEQMAYLKAVRDDANAVAKLARQANGHEVTSVERREARKILVSLYKERGADKLQEAEIRKAGGRRKILGF